MDRVEQLQQHGRPLVAAVALVRVAHPLGALMAEGDHVLVEQRHEAVERAVVRVEQ